MNKVDELIKYYSYLVKYSLEDEAYIAQCVELGIMAHGDSQEEAIKEVKEATKVHLLMLEEDSEAIPQPSNLQVIN
jgi:predicted RNase H-like HicB family nuclease